MPLNLNDVLRESFGIPSFRPSQKEAIENVLAKKDSLVVMPTGGGKSLCYQLPAILLKGTTIVIAPLISLMKDQVDKLTTLGISAAAINSSLTYSEVRDRFNLLEEGRLKLLYIAPERLESLPFIELLSRTPTSLLVIDEAHCISQWGHDFRKSYRRIPDSYKFFGTERPPIIALTATATPDVRYDIIRQLQLDHPEEIVTGFERPNIRYAAMRDARKDTRLIDILHSVSGSSIVYTSSRAKCETLSLMLHQLGFSSEPYHGGMNNDVRAKIQTDFLANNSGVIVATSAFGMGIDKPDVRAVIHYDLPSTLESYYQESGRAGRDGAEALAILLYNPGDEHSQEFMIAKNYPGEDDLHGAYDFLSENWRRNTIGKLFISRAQIAASLDKQDAPIERILEILENIGALSAKQAEMDAPQLSIEPSRDRATVERYLIKSKNSLPAQLLRYLINRSTGQAERVVGADEESLASALLAERTVIRKSLRTLEEHRLINLSRNARFTSGMSVFEIGFPENILSWDELRESLVFIEKQYEHSIEKLRMMQEYAAGWECRSAFILRYFGERTGTWRCGACDVCTSLTDAAANR